MKKYIILLFSAILIFGASCTDESMDFDTNGGKGLAFLHFVGKSESIVARQSGNNRRAIYVSSTTKSDQARTYTISVDPSSTAIEGKHFSLSSKTVTIPAGQYKDSIIITANLDNLTPETVTVNLTLSSDEAIDYGKTYSVSMYLFFEVSIDWLLGTWKWTDYVDGDYDDECVVEVTKINDNTIGITNIWDAEMTVEATVDFNNAKIMIKPDSKFMFYSDFYGYVYMDAVMGSSWRDNSKTDPIVGTCSYTKVINIAPWAPMLNDSGYTFQVAITSTMTRM